MLTELKGTHGSLHSVWKKLVTGAVFCLCSSFSLFVCFLFYYCVKGGRGGFSKEEGCSCLRQSFCKPTGKGKCAQCKNSQPAGAAGGFNSAEQKTDTSADERCTLWSVNSGGGGWKKTHSLKCRNQNLKRGADWFSINCGHSRAWSTFHPECSPGWCIDDLSKGGSAPRGRIHTKPFCTPANKRGQWGGCEINLTTTQLQRHHWGGRKSRRKAFGVVLFFSPLSFIT